MTAMILICLVLSVMGIIGSLIGDKKGNAITTREMFVLTVWILNAVLMILALYNIKIDVFSYVITSLIVFSFIVGLKSLESFLDVVITIVVGAQVVITHLMIIGVTK